MPQCLLGRQSFPNILSVGKIAVGARITKTILVKRYILLTKSKSSSQFSAKTINLMT